VIIKILNSITNTTEEEQQQEEEDGRELMSWRWEWEVMGVKGECKPKGIQPHHYYYVPFQLRGSEKFPCFTKIWHQNIWQNESA
jgi:hypothetical protein